MVVSNTGTGGFVIADAVRFTASGSEQQVQVFARDSVAGETGPDSAQVVFSREAAGPSVLAIDYSLSGSAVSGTDFTAPSGIATIPAGALSVTVPIIPLGDSLAEGDESVLVSITPSAGYFAKPGFGVASVTIRDEAFQEWRAGSFLPGQANDDAVSGPSADPESDGLKNSLEWALATPPLSGNASPLVVANRSAESMDLSFTQRRGLPLGTVGIESSPDFLGWQPAPASVTLFAIDEISTEYDRLTYRWPQSELGGPQLFVRLRVIP